MTLTASKHQLLAGGEELKLPRSVPALTVYEDGRVVPNSAAVELFGPAAHGLCFYAPAPTRPGYTPKLWEVSAGECHLYRTVETNGHKRLRAAGDCPQAGRYLLTPVVRETNRYT